MPTQTQSAGVAFHLDNVNFDIAGKRLLRDISLRLRPGRLYGLIGHNGSGKSTLLKLLSRQFEPSSGRISLQDEAIDSLSAKGFARQVGYLPQQLPASTGLKVRELVALGRYPWHGAVGRFGDKDRALVDQAMGMADVDGFADRMLDTLSGGERQRAWLAMLVAQDTRCLLLDEPISALDVLHQIEVMELIRQLSHDNGLTVVAVLHDINMAGRFCDELVALHSGEKVAQGTPEDVIQPAVLQRIYGLPMGVMHHPDRQVPISYVA